MKPAFILALLLLLGSGATAARSSLDGAEKSAPPEVQAAIEAQYHFDQPLVGAEFAGLGIGSALYRDLFSETRARGLSTITCEYNIEPPNPASRAFHDKFGFHELGTQWVAGGSKRVSLQAAKI